MQILFGLVLLNAAAVGQATVLGRTAGGPRPDLVLVLVLAWSMLRGVAEGTVAGIVGGFALDLLSGGPFGMYAALLGLIGSLTALGEGNLFRGNVPLFMITAALVTVALHGLSILWLQAVGWQGVGPLRFIEFVVPTAVLNALLMPLAFAALQRSVRALGGWRQLEL